MLNLFENYMRLVLKLYLQTLLKKKGFLKAYLPTNLFIWLLKVSE